MAALAWNLKAWYGLLTPNRERGLELVKMEFRRFLHAIVLLPCQIVRTARRVIVLLRSACVAAKSRTAAGFRLFRVAGGRKLGGSGN